MKKKVRLDLIALILSVGIFGTIGLFRRLIPLPSDVLAFSRGIMGGVFLLLLLKGRGMPLDTKAIKEHWKLLVLSGACIGINWILLFEAYRYTTIAVATLCYYFQPVIVVLLSPWIMKEKITVMKGLCVLVAVIGMILVSGILQGSPINQETAGTLAVDYRGVLLGLGAALLYAGVILINKKNTGVPVYEKTVVQLFSAAIVLIPYLLATGSLKVYAMTTLEVIYLIIVGIVHTGIAYALYFWALMTIPAQTAALFSYIDPVVALLLSAVFLREPMTLMTGIGAVLILGSAAVSEQSQPKSSGS